MKKLKIVLMSIIANILMISLLGCSGGSDKSTETAAPTETAGPLVLVDDYAPRAAEASENCIWIWIPEFEYEEYEKEYRKRWILESASIDSVSLNALYKKLMDQDLKISNIRAVIDGMDPETGFMVVDFNKFYVPTFPQQFYILIVKTFGEREGIPKYKYIACCGSDVALDGTGEMLIGETVRLDFNKDDVISFDLEIRPIDEIRETQRNTLLLFESYTVTYGSKKVIAYYNDKNLWIAVEREDLKLGYIIKLEKYFEKGKEFPTDEWLLSFDMVKYIPD